MSEHITYSHHQIQIAVIRSILVVVCTKRNTLQPHSLARRGHVLPVDNVGLFHCSAG